MKAGETLIEHAPVSVPVAEVVLQGARSAKQAIAIGLSRARRAGINLAPPKPGEASEETRKKARKDIEGSAGRSHPPSDPVQPPMR